MALSILFGNKYKKSSIGAIELDVTLRENHNYTSKVTTYPVEDGFTLSDHIINEPIQITLEGIVTDTPLSIFTLSNRSISAFNRLVDLYRKKEIVTVITGIKKYPRMAITSLDIPRDIRTGQSLSFNIELQEILIDETIQTLINEQNLYGGVQSKITRDQVSSGENVPFIQLDPENSLKDQATSQIDYGIQGLQTPPPIISDKINESLASIVS